MTRDEDGRDASLLHMHTHKSACLLLLGMGEMWAWALKTCRVLHTCKHTALLLVNLMLTFSQSVSLKTYIKLKSSSGEDDVYLRWLAPWDDKGQQGKGRQKNELPIGQGTAAKEYSTCFLGGICPFKHPTIHILKPPNTWSALPFSSLSYLLPARKSVFKKNRSVLLKTKYKTKTKQKNHLTLV